MIRKGCVGVAAQQCVISRESSAGMSLMMVRWKSIKEGWSSEHFQGFFSVTQIHITWRIRPGKTWHDANLTPWNMTVKAWDLDLIMSHTYMYKLYFSILDLNTLPGLWGTRTKLNKDTEYVGKTRHCVCVCVCICEHLNQNTVSCDKWWRFGCVGVSCVHCMYHITLHKVTPAPAMTTQQGYYAVAAESLVLS